MNSELRFLGAAATVTGSRFLPDSAYLQEQDAAYANKKGYSRHKLVLSGACPELRRRVEGPALPLYTVADARRALERLRPVPFGQPLTLDGLTVTWRPAGSSREHLLARTTERLPRQLGCATMASNEIMV